MFSFFELINLVITVFVVGLIFSRDFTKEEILFSSKVVGISVILHELAHKISAILLGYKAVYTVSLFGLLLGLFLKLVEFPIIFFIPGYVSIYGKVLPLHQAIISISGPLTNLLLYIFGNYFYKKTKSDFYYALKNINLWLFIINIIPIPPLDGGQFLFSLYKLFLK